MKVDFEEINECIELFGWFHFGKKEFECPGLRKEQIDYYLRNNRLPSPCDKCYKALIFWRKVDFKENLKNFFRMISGFEVNYRGKLNYNVVVFYFRNKEKMLEFLDYLKKKMEEYNIKGHIQWRRACKMYQELKPELWKNAKEFVPHNQ